MIPRTPNVTGSDGAPDSDPMADIASIVDDAMLAGLDPRRFAFTSVYMRFAEREPWERAAADAGASWEVAAYGSSQGHMLRLSRAARPTLRDLTRMRADALTFAHEHAADWLSMSIEDLQQAPSAWVSLTAHDDITLPEPRTSPDIDSDLQAPRVHRGGTA